MRSYFVYEKETSDLICDCHSLFLCGLNAPWAPNEMSIQAPFVSYGACLKDLAKQFQHKCFLSPIQSLITDVECLIDILAVLSLIIQINWRCVYLSIPKSKIRALIQ